MTTLVAMEFNIGAIVIAITALLIAVIVTLTAAILIDADCRDLISGSRKAHSTLTRPPTQVSDISIVLNFILILLKYTGLSPSLATQKQDGTFELPSVSIKALLKATQNDISLFSHAIKPTTSSSQHPQEQEDGAESNPLFLLPALITPLLPQLVTKFRSPIRPLGAVNVSNTFEFLDPTACRNIRAAQTTRPLIATGRMGGPTLPGRRVKRGMTFDIVLEVHAGEKPVFRMVFATLQRARLPGPVPSTAMGESSVADSGKDGAGAGLGEEEMRVDAVAPNRYAALCKDYNPIHVSDIAARAFGFPRKIAHGNLVVAMVVERAVAAARAGGQGESGKRTLGELWEQSSMPSWLRVAFKRPVVVPARLAVRWREDGAEIVKDNGNGEEKVLVEITARERRQ